jgi:hypothetical protein
MDVLCLVSSICSALYIYPVPYQPTLILRDQSRSLLARMGARKSLVSNKLVVVLETPFARSGTILQGKSIPYHDPLRTTTVAPTLQ